MLRNSLTGAHAMSDNATLLATLPEELRERLLDAHGCSGELSPQLSAGTLPWPSARTIACGSSRTHVRLTSSASVSSIIQLDFFQPTRVSRTQVKLSLFLCSGQRQRGTLL